MTDDLANALRRYTITPDADPILSNTITLSGACDVALRPATGEMFVSDFTGGTVHRLLDPFGALVPNGTISGPPVGSALEDARFVDDELWIANFGIGNIIRFAFDAQGNASVAGTVPVSSNVRGMHWNAATRDLYVTECCGTNTLRHYRVANDHSTTAMTPVTGNGLNNPHGMFITPWGELFLANFGGASILRFTLDAQGNPTANGSITGNGLSGDGDLAWAPWGELYVANQASSSVSRFTFDSSHAAVPHGTFTFPSAQRLDWFAILSGAPNGSSSDGGVIDAAGTDGSGADAVSDAAAE